MNWNPFSSFADAVANVAGAVKARWELMTDKWYQARIDKAEAAKAAKATEAQVQADIKAVQENDTDALARRVKAHKSLLAIPAAACLALAVSGCALFRGPQTVVVSQDDVPVPLEHDGRDGYWISKPMLMQYLEIADRYEAAKKAGKL